MSTLTAVASASRFSHSTLPADFAARVQNFINAGEVVLWLRCGANANDSSGNARHFTANGSPTFGSFIIAPGTDDGSVAFDGINDYFSRATDEAFKTSQGTLLLFLRPAEAISSGVYGVFSIDELGVPASGQNGHLTLDIRDSVPHFHIQDSSAQYSIDAGQLAHALDTSLIAEWGPGGMILFQNGAEVGSHSHGGGIENSTVANVYIGGVGYVASPPANLLPANIDELLYFNARLSDADIARLLAREDAPIASSPSNLSIEANGFIDIDVLAVASWVGRRANIEIETRNDNLGTTSITADKTVLFTAGASTGAGSFECRIIDTNGVSNWATINVEITAAQGAGTLVWSWSPSATEANQTFGARSGINAFNGALTGGTTLFRNDYITNRICINRAPDGTPALEIAEDPTRGSDQNQLMVMLQSVAKWQQAPRHITIEFRVRFCAATDATTHKGSGAGTTTGSYPTFDPQGGKVPLGAWAGNDWAGGCRYNGRTLPDRAIGRTSIRLTHRGNPSDWIIRGYTYAWGRGSDCGQSTPIVSSAKFTTGAWHTVKLEVKMADPGTVATNAVANGSSIPTVTQSGNGFVKMYLNDVEISAAQLNNLTHMPRNTSDPSGAPDASPSVANGYHIDSNWCGWWFNHNWGGAAVPTEQWLWCTDFEMRRID